MTSHAPTNAEIPKFHIYISLVVLSGISWNKSPQPRKKICKEGIIYNVYWVNLLLLVGKSDIINCKNIME
jgi:hypothetical protein